MDVHPGTRHHKTPQDTTRAAIYVSDDGEQFDGRTKDRIGQVDKSIGEVR
jgi:hypothetical protein